MSIKGSKKKGKSKKKRRTSRGKLYGVPKFDDNGKLRTWIKKKLR